MLYLAETENGFVAFSSHRYNLRLLVVQRLISKEQGPKTGAGYHRADGDHNRDLVENRCRRHGSGQNLACHHTWKGYDAHAQHGIQRRQHRGLKGLLYKRAQNNVRRRPRA